jgi:hypothetical protein
MVDLPEELIRKVVAYMERPLHYYAYITGLKQVSNYEIMSRMKGSMTLNMDYYDNY